MEKIKFLIAIHCHQPVGNFEHIFEMAFDKVYLPFLQTLERYPTIKISLHYSGSLLDWLENKRPDFISRIKDLIIRKQIEIISAGYYEPILVLLPEEDRIGQIKLLNEKISSLWGFNPKGAWLTERVWEPDLPRTFREAGIEYTIVDDVHFEKAGKNRENLWGYYITEYDNKILKIFPGSKFLRYALPFKLPGETIKYLRQALDSGRKAIIFADDGEKFGLWPGTYKWVYEEKWLENFFRVIEENNDWLETITFSEYIEKYPHTEKIYLPCASYDEMLEWSEGYFRNFLAKYPEANHMHKRMWEVSEKIQKREERLNKRELIQAKQFLYRAQNNDAYWHGVFGGLYLNHLRHSVYAHLIKAENIVEKDVSLNYEIKDFDCDGKEEVILFNRSIKLYIDKEEKAGIYELDYREKEINLVNTISRRKEKYHEKIKEKILCAGRAQSTVSIHDLEKNIPEEWKEFLVYDRYRKGCLLEYFLDKNISKENFLKGEYEEKEKIIKNYFLESINKDVDLLKLVFSKEIFLDGLPFLLRKIIAMGKEKEIFFQYLITNRSQNSWEGKLGIEFNFSLWDNFLSILGERDSVDSLLIKDSWFNIDIEINWNKLGEIWHFPVETIYETESGFEKNYQELGIFFLWKLSLGPEENWQLSGNLRIK